MVDPDQKSERRTLRLRARKLRSWFRNLSGPKKAVATAVTLAGGVGAILGAINGAVTLTETVNEVVRPGGDPKAEIKAPPMPQYSKGEVQEAVEKQQEAVQEYAYPYTPPEQIKAPGEDEAVGASGDMEERPIRADYMYHGGYMEGTIVGDFDPNRDPQQYLKAGLIAFSYPRAWIDVTSQAKDETVTLSPYLVIEVIDVRPMPERANYVLYPTGGAGGIIRYFTTTLSPERKGTFYAPQWTSETSLRFISPPNKRIYPYFTLRPGNKEIFLLDITMLPDYFYHFRIGVQYSFKGRQRVDWSEEFVAGVPLEADVWQLSQDGSRFQNYGNLQKYKVHIQSSGGRVY